MAQRQRGTYRYSCSTDRATALSMRIIALLLISVAVAFAQPQVLARQAGTWSFVCTSGCSGGGGGGTSSTFGAAFPATGTAIGVSDGTNMTFLLVDGSGFLKVNGSGVTQPVSGTFWQATQPISAAALPLPTGAATAAKQPALGTAGTASADVITIQGIASMTPVKVDGSGSTQPVSGTVAATQSGTWTVQPGNTANTTAWKVDGSAVTQPVSAAALPLPTGASTAAKQPAIGTAGTASADVLTIQGAASMTKLLVTPDSVALPANQSVNVAQVNGVTTTMGNGVSGTGVQRVTLASDSTGQVALATGANTIGALTANQSTNVTQINGVTPLMGAGNTGTGSPRVTIATDQATVPVSFGGNGTVINAQQAVTASAVALATTTSKNVCIKAMVANTINVFVGATGVTTSTGMELPPGVGVCLPVSNANLLFVIASTTGASVSWIGTN